MRKYNISERFYYTMLSNMEVDEKNLIFYFTAVPLTMRDMGWRPPPVTVCRMDAAYERTWKYLQRVTGGGRQLMSRIGLMPVNPDTVVI